MWQYAVIYAEVAQITRYSALRCIEVQQTEVPLGKGNVRGAAVYRIAVQSAVQLSDYALITWQWKQ
ncbi:MAG: hypothetical protein F6K41_42945 [Symploca sp. SIO3E6]|nr:hypothetical protein [Caldora sp. SIO3E6]